MYHRECDLACWHGVMTVDMGSAVAALYVCWCVVCSYGFMLQMKSMCVVPVCLHACMASLQGHAKAASVSGV
jgi:hypothetical protein